MSRYLAYYLNATRELLQDEDTSDLRWSDAELTGHILDIVSEISSVVPRERKSTLTTTADSKDLSLSTLTDWLRIYRIEYKVGNAPPNYRNFHIWGDTLTMDIDAAPSADDESVYVWWECEHELTSDSTTLPTNLERLVPIGAAARAATAWGEDNLNKILEGGQASPQQMIGWGQWHYLVFRNELQKLKPKRTWKQFPTG